MKIFEHTLPQLTKMLHNLDRWLDKGAEHAKAKKFEPDRLLELRLAPDMYPLVRQVQSACDTAKYLAAHLSGKTAPSHPDTEKTFVELKTRIRTVLAYLETFKREDFDGAADRKVAPKWIAPKHFKGDEYLNQLALPNFYFHATTAYDILRHNGVDIGKEDFIGHMPLHD